MIIKHSPPASCLLPPAFCYSRQKARLKVAKVHAKIARCREDFLHKLSRKIVNENQVIAVEDLGVKNLVKNHKLAKAISDCGWGMFGTMLKYKAEEVWVVHSILTQNSSVLML